VPAINAPSSHPTGAPTVPGPLGAYTLLTRLARGGMADVFLAERSDELGSERYVAVKVLLAKLAQRRKFIDMFRSEGRLGMLLKHPNITETVEVGTQATVHYIAMAFIDGQDLGKVLRYFRNAEAPVPIHIALYIVREVLHGLAHAHDLTDEVGQPLHLVNRDVSPANIMLGYDGVVRLIDFGIAQALLDYRSQIGSIKGKITYMSPEQVRGLALDARSDIFSLGTVLYQLLTSREPFAAPSEFEQMERVREAHPTPVSEVQRRIDPALSDIVACAMSKDPALRYQSAGEMAAAIERYARVAGLNLDGHDLSEFMRTEFADARAQLVGAIETAREALSDGISHEIDEDPTDPHKDEKAKAAMDNGQTGDAVRAISEELAAIRSGPPLRTNPRWLLPAAILMLTLAILLLALAIFRGR
jgi:serine/threonine protein kinase